MGLPHRWNSLSAMSWCRDHPIPRTCRPLHSFIPECTWPWAPPSCQSPTGAIQLLASEVGVTPGPFVHINGWRSSWNRSGWRGSRSFHLRRRKSFPRWKLRLPFGLLLLRELLPLLNRPGMTFWARIGDIIKIRTTPTASCMVVCLRGSQKARTWEPWNTRTPCVDVHGTT